MTRDQVNQILDRVLSWSPDDQERVARFVREVERRRGGDDITNEEWKIIEELFSKLHPQVAPGSHVLRFLLHPNHWRARRVDTERGAQLLMA